MSFTSIAVILAVVVLAVFAFLTRRRSAEIDPNDPPTPAEAEDARQFARLLVSEIVRYNRKAVEEGRLHRDLSSRLGSEIDRSRDLFERRVRPVVRAENDAFADALVDILADGDPGALADAEEGGDTVVH